MTMIHHGVLTIAHKSRIIHKSADRYQSTIISANLYGIENPRKKALFRWPLGPRIRPELKA